MTRRLFFIAPLAIVAFVVFIALGGAVVRQLWNWLLPPLFGWHPITFWQALALLALCRILFGRFGPYLSPRSRMTPEERDRFRQRMRERFGFGPSTRESKGPQTT